MKVLLDEQLAGGVDKQYFLVKRFWVLCNILRLQTQEALLCLGSVA